MHASRCLRACQHVCTKHVPAVMSVPVKPAACWSCCACVGDASSASSALDLAILPAAKSSSYLAAPYMALSKLLSLLAETEGLSLKDESSSLLLLLRLDFEPSFLRAEAKAALLALAVSVTRFPMPALMKDAKPEVQECYCNVNTCTMSPPCHMHTCRYCYVVYPVCCCRIRRRSRHVRCTSEDVPYEQHHLFAFTLTWYADETVQMRICHCRPNVMTRQDCRLVLGCCTYPPRKQGMM